MKSIAFVLKTIKLEYDDRVRKEALALSKWFDVKIFVLLEDNEEREGVTAYGIPFKSISLRSRKLFPSAKGIAVKTTEFFLRVRPLLKEYDVVWAHNVESFLFPFLCRKTGMVWDLHEIPNRFLRNPLSRRIFGMIEEKCDLVIHANEFRIQYLVEAGLVQDREKHLAIRNYPDEELIKSVDEDPGFELFKRWVGDDDYVYLQGLQSAFRFPEETIGAVLNVSGIKAVVVGRFSQRVKDRLVDQFGSELEERVYFCGMVDQLKIPAYIRGALFSIVFYETSKPNNRYCEPNRMYQSIVLGKPVIVGCNEPMRYLVEEYGFGIALEGDGSNRRENEDAIRMLMKDYDRFVRNVSCSRRDINWESQEGVFEEIAQRFG